MNSHAAITSSDRVKSIWSPRTTSLIRVVVLLDQ